MSKRASNEGAIYQRKQDGRWVGSIHLGYTDGKRQRRTFYGSTQGEVLTKMGKAKAKLLSGLPIPPERMTVAHLLDQWLEQVQLQKNRASTYKRHSDLVRIHLIPGLGRIRLAKLTPADIQQFLNAKRLPKEAPDGKTTIPGLSPRTVQYLRTVLRAALAHGMRWGYIGINAAALTDAPKLQKYHVEGLTVADARKLLDSIKGDAMAPLFVVALATGLRQGELLALRWQDVDLEAATLTVAGSLRRVKGSQYEITEPKTEQSRRVVTLPAMAVTALKDRRVHQKEERLLAYGEWSNPWDLVFTGPTGQPLYGVAVTRQFQACSVRAEIKPRRFHDLRHGTATLLLAAGVPLKVVQTTLGHATIAVTADIYAHVLPELQREAASRMDEALQGAL